MGQGPLSGVRIVEFAGIGPGPFCGMLLSDLGADVVRIARPGDGRPGRAADVMSRGRRSIGLNLKDPKDVEVAMQLLERADGLIEGFRPGVMERNGLGPDAVLKRNPKLVYGRMTGWGQTGALSQAAGHDLNYIAITGALHAMGDDKLKVIAAELIRMVRKSVTIDWTLRETARARIRVIVKRILNRWGYPPDLQEEAVKTVLQQAELLCAEWSDAAV